MKIDIKKKWIVSTFVLMLLFNACGKKKENYPLDLEIRPVQYTIIDRKENMLQREFTGIIASTALSQLSFRVSGTVVEKYVGLGDRVVKGQALAKLDPIDYEVKYQQAYAQLENNKAVLTEAKSNFERDRLLYLDNSISKAQYEASQANYQSKKSSVEAAAKNVEFNKLQLEYTVLTSPVDGSIAKVDTEINEAVTPQTPIFTIDTQGTFEVLFSVSEDIISRIRLGERISVGVDALQDKVYATITNIGTVSNDFGNTYPIKAFINNPPQTLRVGMTAVVYMDLNINAKNEPMIIVPINAVLNEGESSKYVYIITDIKDNIGIVKKVPVELGTVSSLGVEILSGLNNGEYLVTLGATQVSEGQKVKLMQKGE